MSSAARPTIDPPATQQMQCMEVWGGSQLTSRSVEFGGLDAWVYSKPYAQAQHGGDVYYASSCATGRITRLLLADVSGHGTSVATTAADLRTLMRRFVNRLDQGEFVRLLNRQFAELSEAGTFATAVVTTFFAPSRRLLVCNAGHPRPLIYHASQQRWDFLGHEGEAVASTPRNIPLGILKMAEYENFDVELSPGDCLVCYTDALIESSDADGEMLGEAGLLRIMRLVGGVPPHDLTQIVLREIADRYPQNLSDDDVTVMVVRATGKEPGYSLPEKVNALWRMIRSLFSRSGPALLPDLSMANMAGAIIPALGRRWRSGTR
jgi:serine phosphatase RsbU (regulator of sigma subunit)